MTEFELPPRDRDLTADERKAVKRHLAAGQELVEGDFAEDEKWRIVETEPRADAIRLSVAIDVDPLDPAPNIGNCEECGKPVNERDNRVEDKRGIFHGSCYTAPPARARRA